MKTSLQKAFIIGATSGIAQALAERLAAAGATLFLAGRSGAKLDIMARDLRLRHGVKVEVEAVVFEESANHGQVVRRAWEWLGGMDAAFICHGVLKNQKDCERDFDEALHSFQINLLSAISFAGEIANHMETARHGSLVVISSVAGDRGRQSNYIYGSAKAGLTVFLQGLRNRLSPAGVRVLTVKPGYVDTPMAAHIRSPLKVSADRAAGNIVRAAEKKRDVIYTPCFWRLIMFVVRSIPEFIFKRMKL
ncbi:decaprenylphospho-beta-D-erythro-pentofuranosid-2-ulose 2-reductase [Ereboglobus sp. PH5-5]|uniref:SDR family oxidoreductase n=1 Tax=Ereboglobus sp. PH5-5 TaxID=2940529 RepID=UPI0024075119|nr:SDR family oxidoreductase [Ereboglobus sp. PH5-5]MDF9834002.1 decaprenylphospho-beta-D-erythro-pentofuranosid-2-ulose 2-reductase [Ereboglobus sp. PH5-5]